MKIPLPKNESQRLEELRSYAVLDTPAEQSFDDLTMLAAQICQVPMVMVSLVDENRQWFKSKVGIHQTETPRDISFCTHAILNTDTVLEVPDAEKDPRFAGSSLVTGDPHIRFYAGAPLVSSTGHGLGSLCVMDRIPRTLTPEQRAALQALSRRVVAQLELRRQTQELTAREQEGSRILLLAGKSRRALLSVLEDEKLTMASLRESEARFRQMAESIDEVFWMSDVEKSQIIYISPGYELIWGRKCEELYTSMQIWVDSLYLEDRTRVLHAAKTKQVSGNYDETYRIVRPDGAMRWIRDRAYPVKEPDGQVRRVVGVAEDITEQKRLEEQFLRAQRMEAIGTLAGGVAHDLNNILAPILMAAGLLKDKITSEHEQAVLGMIETSAQRGAAIIKQLLTFSRGIEGTRGPVQLRHLIKDMVHIMEETFPRNIVIEQLVPNDLWTVTADATQMHQVLMNLCVNARDAMPAGGELNLHSENLQIESLVGQVVPAGKPGPYVVMTVTDTGTGIPANIIKRIFDPFFTTKELGKGTGLGLSTVMGIVRSHGGFVTVYSEPGRGTSFKVYLPAADTAEIAAGAGSPKPMAGGRGELILLVDDEESIRSTTCDFLEEHNYRALAARDGKEALTLFLANQDRVRLVLTDVMMPVMGGLDLVRALRTIRPELEIIATTGLDNETKLAEFAALGVTTVLLKPCTQDDLLTAIRRQLDRAVVG